jgi:hypothetical protein
MRRRLLAGVGGVLLMLAVAAPAAAADRVMDSGTFYQFTIGASECGPTTCSDTFLDVFSVDQGVVAVCYFEGTFHSRNGRLISDTSGCVETAESVISITEDLDVIVAATEIQLFSCSQRHCTEGDVVTVSASASATTPVVTASGRVTVNEGSCRSRITFTDASAEVAGTIDVDGSSIDANGFAVISEQTVATTCR